MPRRGEYKERPQLQPGKTSRALPARIGPRIVEHPHRLGTAYETVDPAKYACSALIAELADEWVELATATSLSAGGSRRYAGAVRSFGRFVDKHCVGIGVDPAKVVLADELIDLPEVIYAWEVDLIASYRPASNQPADCVSALMVLIDQRGQRAKDLPETLRRRAAAPPLLARPGNSKPLDEFSNAERLTLRRWARADVTAMEERLSRGRALMEEGADPVVAGWDSLANLAWAIGRGELVAVSDLRRAFGAPTPIVPAHLAEHARRGRRVCTSGLFRYVAQMLFPTELELNAFRVLLLLQMTDTTPEELLDLKLEDIEFTSRGARLVEAKQRADRVRPEMHEEITDVDDVVYEGAGRWDVPGLLRRILAVTELLRETIETPPYLFVAHAHDARSHLSSRRAAFCYQGRNFTAWISSHAEAEQVKISKPYDVRRLRKTAKVAKIVALGGTANDLAGDDHHVAVFRNNYAHGTTAHVLSGRAINRAQSAVFSRATGPVTVPERTRERLGEEQVAASLGLSTEQGAALRDGELDMGVVNCRDPYASPHTPSGRLCHVAPGMCLLCRNAVVFAGQLPQVLLMADHIEAMRTALAPLVWHELWEPQAKAVTELLAEFADSIPEARRVIEERSLRLDLPLGMRTEYDRR